MIALVVVWLACGLLSAGLFLRVAHRTFPPVAGSDYLLAFCLLIFGVIALPLMLLITVAQEVVRRRDRQVVDDNYWASSYQARRQREQDDRHEQIHASEQAHASEQQGCMTPNEWHEPIDPMAAEMMRAQWEAEDKAAGASPSPSSPSLVNEGRSLLTAGQMWVDVCDEMDKARWQAFKNGAMPTTDEDDGQAKKG